VTTALFAVPCEGCRSGAGQRDTTHENGEHGHE
jgi:hypothetical protein